LFGEVLQISPPFSTIGKPHLGISSHVHHHHMNNKLQAYDISKIAHLELALDLFFTYYLDVLKVHMRAHSIIFLFFKPYFS
jgi:hypothetical protein